MPHDSPSVRPWRERLACWFGKHPELECTPGPYPYPDAYNCTRCGRLDHLIDNHVVFEAGDGTPVTGIRYANLEQWMEERGGY